MLKSFCIYILIISFSSFTTQTRRPRDSTVHIKDAQTKFPLTQNHQNTQNHKYSASRYEIRYEETGLNTNVASKQVSFDREINDVKRLESNLMTRFKKVKQVDLMFLLDSSASVPLEGWKSILQFTQVQMSLQTLYH